ncbi:MAG: TetR/AcrR family transcriptional regulator [Proteobacteria bacterium]|nr:TetR/AcrR family transcriptional regulator [Pseudomonadota bacterium]
MKRKKILEAAAIVFSKKGFHQARMDEIAALANVAKGTLYYNFSSKSMLFSATVTEGLETIVKQITEKLNSNLPFIEHFRLLVEYMISLYLKNNRLAKILLNELSSGIDSKVLAEIESVQERFIVFIADLLLKGQKRGYIKPLDIRTAAIAVAGQIDSLCKYHLRNPGKISKEQIVESLFDILSTGLLKPNAS